MTEQQKIKSKALLKLFKIDGKPADAAATDGQIEIFHSIISKQYSRVQIISSTQYGKSLFIALGCIILACVDGELVSIVAPTNDKAQIIIRYFIQHLSDHALFYSQLEKESSIEKLQMETTKDRIILKNKGGIFTLSVQAGNTQKGFQAAMGEGSKIVVQDESALIPDDIEATIFRMIAGKKDAIYIKVGNPFYRNHFYKSSRDPNYHQIFIDYKRGLREGRYNQQFIDEAGRKPFFDILYGCEFPAEDMTDVSGYTRLFPDSLLERAQRKGVVAYGETRLGCDIAEGGGDFNAFVFRSANMAKLVAKFQAADTMLAAGSIIQYGREYKVFDHNWFVDSLGVGKGVYDRLCEQKYTPFSVRFSERANDHKQFANQRAECYWAAFKWLNEGGTLEPHFNWDQLSTIRYKVDSSGRIQIIPKEQIRKEGHQSPDIADAFVSTFARKAVITESKEERQQERELLKQFDSYRNNKASRRSLLRK
ncbi:MAG: hypothetical protein V4436_02020 [Patescibacteria group bacterium]